jgi:hypothetical protein
MTRTTLRVGAFALALFATGLLITPGPVSPQTAGMERRQDRRGDRDDARATRQTGRHTGRDVKQACRDAGGNPMDCRQQKRATKQGARQTARDIKRND